MFKILVACEESQAVTIAFRNRGFNAYSCDIKDCTGGYPEFHIKGDVLEEINKDYQMMVAFPPCTHLAVSGARHFKDKIADGRQQEGINFFLKLANANIKHIAIENPIGIMSKQYKKPDQIIHPYYFNDPYSKSTCLWLKNLPKLFHAKEVDLFNDTITHTEKGEFVVFDSGKRMPKWYAEKWNKGTERSKTFKGIANAMAEQWGNYLAGKH